MSYRVRASHSIVYPSTPPCSKCGGKTGCMCQTGGKSRRCKSKTYRTRRTRHTRKRQRFGGGLETAKIYFHKNIKKQYPNIVHDAFLKSRQGVVFPPAEDVEMYDDNQFETNFKPMLDEIIGMTDNKELIDFVMQLYLTGNMGVPNSMENIGRLIDNANKFKVLKQNNKNDGKQLILKDFPSLSALEEFIDAKQGELQQIIEKNLKRSKTSSFHKKLKEEGEDDVEVVLETPNYIVYRPTTEAGSKFYGRKTRWCTAAENRNRFADYTADDMKLYIIQSKIVPMDKTQFHPMTMQFMNSDDSQVSAEEIKRLFQDQDLKNWFRQTSLFEKFAWSGVPITLENRLNPQYSYNDLFFLRYRYYNNKDGFNIHLFNALFGLREMPQALVENIKKRLLMNVKNTDDGLVPTDPPSFLFVVRLLSKDELDYIFEDASFREKFMKLESASKNTPWFFWSKFRKYYTEYFDNEEIMLQTLTTPGRPTEHFEIISDRLKDNLDFLEKLISADYGPHDDATKYCRKAYEHLSEEKISKLKETCDKINEEQMKIGKQNRFHPSYSGNLYI